MSLAIHDATKLRVGSDKTGGGLCFLVPAL